MPLLNPALMAQAGGYAKVFGSGCLQSKSKTQRGKFGSSHFPSSGSLRGLALVASVSDLWMYDLLLYASIKDPYVRFSSILQSFWNHWEKSIRDLEVEYKSQVRKLHAGKFE